MTGAVVEKMLCLALSLSPHGPSADTARLYGFAINRVDESRFKCVCCGIACCESCDGHASVDEAVYQLGKRLAILVGEREAQVHHLVGLFEAMLTAQEQQQS